MTIVLQLNAVSKSYGETKALRELSFAIEAGEFVALLGPNGAGKSTLFQIAAGLFEPDAGDVEVFGMRYRDNASAILADLGVVFQARSVDLDMTVNANLRFHGGLFGLYGATLKQRITSVTELLDIAPLLKKPVRTLSGGNQRRVEIARALLNQPRLLLMDEPSVGLDPSTRRLLAEHIALVRRQHDTAILWATHIVEEVENADRVVLIAAGQVVQIGTPAELMSAAKAATLTDAYIALTGHTPAA